MIKIGKGLWEFHGHVSMGTKKLTIKEKKIPPCNTNHETSEESTNSNAPSPPGFYHLLL